jgi:general secretion pathway protein G
MVMPRMSCRRGFTLIELLVVLAALGALLALVVPRYVDHVQRAHETVLKHNLKHLRAAIDQFHADRDRYPNQLEDLVSQRYLKEIPLDPITDRKDSWIVVAPQDGSAGNVRDVRSGASEVARDGSAYAAW